MVDGQGVPPSAVVRRRARPRKLAMALGGIFPDVPRPLVALARPAPPKAGEACVTCQHVAADPSWYLDADDARGQAFGVLRALERVGVAIHSGAATWSFLCDPELGGCGRRGVIATLTYAKNKQLRGCCKRCLETRRERPRPAGDGVPGA